MAKQVINVGLVINDGTGDAIRTGAQKINDNFTELYTLLGGTNGAPLEIVSKITAGNGVVVSSSYGEVLVSAKTASSLEAGVVKIGTGVSINDGVLSAPVYSLPRANTNILGGIKVGDGLNVESDGTLNANPGAYTLPVATSQVLGGVKVGSGLSINSGVLSVTNQFSLPTASASILGGVKVGSRLTITDGVLDADLQISNVTALNNGVHSLALTSTGKLALPGAGVVVDTDQFNAAGPNTVIYTTNDTYIRAVKLVVFAEKIVNGYQSQACEIIGTIDESANLIYTSTYGVVYTGAGPLFTIASSYDLPTQSFIISATPTGADTINIRTHVTEMFGTQP
jgi:acetyltransferase-like isoleucine patch superfamily enzyme